ncbi:hypothetical protein GJAV_G00005620 [Gymnothorax javanicus]|nr:hypothetical protein GJAV_G00005620 [Gymnothorax javanicus]
MTTSGEQTAAAPVPLDLRTKRPDGKAVEEDAVTHSQSSVAKSCKANSMDDGKVKTEEMCVRTQVDPGHSNGIKEVPINIQHPSQSTAVTTIDDSMLKTEPTQKSDIPEFSRTAQLPALKYEMDGSTTTNCDSKTLDKSVSRLPLRKRPFPQEEEMNGQLRTPPGSQCPQASKNNDVPRTYTAKLSKRKKHERHFSRPHVQLQPFPIDGHGDWRQRIDQYPHMATLAPFYSYVGYPVLPSFTSPSAFINVPVAPLPFPVHTKEELEHLSIEAATWQDEDGDTALHIAIAKGLEAVVHRLILTLVQAQKGLDIYNNLRQTPLHLAVITNQILAHPSSQLYLEVHNYEGLTPLLLAVQNVNKTLVTMLLNSRADINAVDMKSGRSPLIHAVENNSMEMVHFLIENGSSVNAQSYSGNTALHSACGRGQVEMVRVLLRNGADSSLKNYHNDTALMVAKNKKVTDVLRGKGSRSQNLKPLLNSPEASSPHRCTPRSSHHSADGTPVQSPSHIHHRSPLANYSASHSQNDPPSHCVITQSAESQPRGKDQLQLLVVHPAMTADHNQRMAFPIQPLAPGCNSYQSSLSDCHMACAAHRVPSAQAAEHPQELGLVTGCPLDLDQAAEHPLGLGSKVTPGSGIGSVAPLGARLCSEAASRSELDSRAPTVAGLGGRGACWISLG